MVTHSSILAWRIPWTEEPGCKESDTTEQITLSLSSRVNTCTELWIPPPLLLKDFGPRFIPFLLHHHFLSPHWTHFCSRNTDLKNPTLTLHLLWAMPHFFGSLDSKTSLKVFCMLFPGFPSDVVVRNPPANSGDIKDAGLITGSGDPLKKVMATYSSILAWRIPWTEEPGSYSPQSHKRVEHA